MVEKLKIGLRIIVSLPVIILVLIIATAVGLPALIGYLILIGAHVLSQNIKKNPFLALLSLPILLTIVAIGHVFFIPLAIASIPLLAYLDISEYLAGRRLNKIRYQIT